MPVHLFKTKLRQAVPALVCLSLLGGCGGQDAAQQSSAVLAVQPRLAATTTFSIVPPALPVDVAAQVLEPAFHAAPMLLDEPDDLAVAHPAPHRQDMSVAAAGMPTRHMTAGLIRAARQARARAGDSLLAPAASGAVVATYTPAQIRAAYGFPALPAGIMTATQAAQLGAGQTIYIVDAMHDPNAAAELAAFNQKFGLPGCTTRMQGPGAALPLAAASPSACELVLVYTTSAGAVTASAPAFDAGWATEIALDLQWAHASAPLARLVLIEVPDASVNSLLSGIRLANAMGPGIVSMSFGGAEGNWTASADSVFGGAGMSYLAATGDNGAGVSWPAVSDKVVAVGGTSLSYSGSGVRSETGWSGTGGGTSAWVNAPAYQASNVPNLGAPARRTVADVAFNADPGTGQYVAVMQPGSSTVSWISAGGTSLATPQWAGILAVANARRAQAAKAALGHPHAMLYGQIGTVPTLYASAFSDIAKGQNGSCSACVARTGYDILSGLGTPNVGSLLDLMAGNTAPTPAPAPAPIVTAARIDGVANTALAFTISASGANPLSLALSGAPAGMLLGANGTVSWAAPVAGSYAVLATATDSKTGLKGSATYTVVIAAPPLPPVAPVVTAATVQGKPGTPLSYQVAVQAANTVSYTLATAPAGMTISAAGVLAWPAPLAGSYAVTVTAKDGKTGLSGKGVITVKIVAAGPSLTIGGFSGTAGKTLTGTVLITDPGATSLSISLSGAPLGMVFGLSGTTLTASWPAPVAGSYSIKVKVTDNAGLSASATIPMVVAAK